MGRISQEEDSLGNKQTYKYDYDLKDRMIKVTEPSGAKTTYHYKRYTYDLVGNRLSKMTLIGQLQEVERHTYNRKNQFLTHETQKGVTHFTYDEQGNILEVNGPQGQTTYSYNAKGL